MSLEPLLSADEGLCDLMSMPLTDMTRVLLVFGYELQLKRLGVYSAIWAGRGDFADTMLLYAAR
jgi:hypothetical protein